MRKRTEPGKKLQRNNITLKVNLHQVIVRGEVVELTDTEFELLYLFLKHPTKIFSIQNLKEK